MENFIGQYLLDDVSICDKLINYYKEHPEHIKEVDNQAKNCFEISTRNIDRIILDVYFEQLKIVLDKYLDKFEFCRSLPSFAIKTNFNLQHYKPSQSYNKWHCERVGGFPHLVNRVLVFITYLNDVTDEGETEWYYQGVKVQPRKGLTVIWPAEWTHTHRGIPSQTQDKYIFTGWYSF